MVSQEKKLYSPFDKLIPTLPFPVFVFQFLKFGRLGFFLLHKTLRQAFFNVTFLDPAFIFPFCSLGKNTHTPSPTHPPPISIPKEQKSVFKKEGRYLNKC